MLPSLDLTPPRRRARPAQAGDRHRHGQGHGRRQRRPPRRLAGLLACALVSLLAVTAGAAGGNVLKPWLGAGDQAAAPWHVVGLPRQAKPFTQFRVVALEGERVLRVEADQSYGNLVMAVPPDTAAHSLSWRWRLDEANAQADLRRKDGDDSALKVCAFFDEPLSAVPFVERQLLRMARGLSSEPLPAATVCYVWDSRLAPGTTLVNAFTRRVRLIVLRGPESPLHRWHTEQRDIVADYMRLFGDETDSAPPLMGVGLGGDADNTHGRSLGHLADLSLQ
ncbi:DUF3047 domain-containing protein [Aquabacterium sp. OR-4]|uniref:DUF3047 domain-containing protein n=1 Tax=Aquabacterium sp. OR-4 TaxID=2978127 RepID=UPI0021B342F2|nr:DUF3047 domain-containing protein [Aquabacterium sp. OR-4]MDT7836231.1 DUF3047 domain-containing protein [Aquabacterium sp. OR-4]